MNLVAVVVAGTTPRTKHVRAVFFYLPAHNVLDQLRDLHELAPGWSLDAIETHEEEPDRVRSVRLDWRWRPRSRRVG